MNRTLYLECTSGVSGDMLLGALSHAAHGFGIPFSQLQELVSALPLAGADVTVEEKTLNGISTWHVDVLQESDQPLRTLPQILPIIQGADVPQSVKDRAEYGFQLLAKAEAHVHGTTVDDVHFHEVGAVDTVVDILGASYLLALLQVDRVVVSPVDMGAGFINISHGRVPVPAPAVAELACGLEIFSSMVPPEGCETATPTGLALLRAMSAVSGPMPKGRLLSVGYGSGGRSCDAFPSCVRAFVMAITAQEFNTSAGEGGDCND
ncbi:MAG: LarC family nickel insertion protein [Desulfovibrio sp.]